MAEEQKISKAQRERQAEETARVIHGTIVALFAIQARAGTVTVEQIAVRLGRSPAEIVQWIQSRKGWDMARVSDFCVAMGVEPHWMVRPLKGEPPNVAKAIDLLKGALAYEQHDSAGTHLIRAAVWALGGSFDA